MTEILHMNGRREVVNNVMTLHDMKAIVGGPIEVVHLPNKTQIVVGVHAAEQGLPTNLAASNLAGRRLVGPAIITDELK